MMDASPESPLARRLFTELADGRLRSGEELAGSLGVTRAAVWKGVRRLRDLGLPIEARAQ